ncbi:MAG: efflux transporter outer membrane subunit [Candidatus Adiutrix sp.]|jgi:multidrug efflux system outer membrane protein|nr:efflux transporter outer membrane subunit [Candidatus Adiutrix sp.]
MPIFILLSLFSAGCSLAPDYVRPHLVLPQAWLEPAPDGLEVQWWKRFQDDALNALIEEALKNNRDILQAAQRIDFARAQLGLARSDLFPAPGAAGNAGRSRGSLLANPPAQPGHETNSSHAADLSAAWEIDLWGKLRNLNKAAAAKLLAAESTHEAIWLSVAGQTAKGYFLLRAFDLQESIASDTLETREESLRIYSARYKQGTIDELDLLRVKAEVEAARSAMFTLRVGRDAAESALAALIGRPPQAIMTVGTINRGLALGNMITAPIFPSGLPSALLERRPDIRVSEEALKATNYNIGAARAAFFPSLSLTGLLGSASVELDDLFTGEARTWQFGGALYLPLNFWRIQSNLRGSEAQQRESIIFYQKTVENAFREIRNALSEEQQYAKVVGSLGTMSADLRKAVKLVKTRYDNGYSTYLEVLDAERSLFTAEMELVSARTNLLNGIVNVCLALGGGWKE